MTRYVWDTDKRKWVLPKERPAAKGPYIWNDLPPYMSPLGTGEIDGRRARREDMARAGCREVDPSERPDIAPKTPERAAEERAQLEARGREPFDMGERTRERLMRGK